MGNDILVVAEHLKGEFADITFELLGKGRELASATGGTLCVAVFGSGLDSSALGAADRILSIDHERLADLFERFGWNENEPPRASKTTNARQENA